MVKSALQVAAFVERLPRRPYCTDDPAHGLRIRPQASALAYHAQVGVLTESWSPLGRKWRIVEDLAIVALASEAGVSPSRLILRWHYQLGTIPLPKSGSPERQRENLDIFSFSLSSEQMAAISALGRPDGRQADQNPEYYEEF